ncbi:MAG: hypothetical protein KC776_05005 [Myxococcales bacterium]|nr:hypothetical protein [Myxococcales bacterium]MCB9580890.1 hypothetical protein [Polyangiaceae bacterium]
MIRAAVGRAAAVAQLAAALMLLVLAIRFGVSAVTKSVESKNPELGPASSASAAPTPVVTKRPPPASVPTVERGKSLRLPMVISIGPDRSELYVNGVRLGHTPFVGEVTCKAGEKIRIELVPPRGTPKSYERLCVPGTVRVAD